MAPGTSGFLGRYGRMSREDAIRECLALVRHFRKSRVTIHRQAAWYWLSLAKQIKRADNWEFIWKNRR
jgi:hypothetical protein